MNTMTKDQPRMTKFASIPMKSAILRITGPAKASTEKCKTYALGSRVGKRRNQSDPDLYDESWLSDVDRDYNRRPGGVR